MENVWVISGSKYHVWVRAVAKLLQLTKQFRNEMSVIVSIFHIPSRIVYSCPNQHVVASFYEAMKPQFRGNTIIQNLLLRGKGLVVSIKRLVPDNTVHMVTSTIVA